MRRISAWACCHLLLVVACAARSPAQSSDARSPARRSGPVYRLQVTPSTMTGGSASLEIDPDRWVARGFDLKTLIAQVYDFDPRRVDIPDASLADARYDIILTTPNEMETDALQGLAIEALMKKLGLRVVHESREIDVYVLTAPGGPSAAMHRHVANSRAGVEADDAEEFNFEERHCTGVASSHGLTARRATMPDFGRELEPDLDRPLIDETHLTGGYDFNLDGYGDQATLFKLLHDELGLTVVPARRNVDLVVVQSVEKQQAGL